MLDSWVPRVFSSGCACELSGWYLGNGTLFRLESRAPETAREDSDGAEQRGNRLSGSQEIPRPAFVCGVVSTQAALGVAGAVGRLGNDAGPGYLCRPVSGPGEGETLAKTNSPAVPGAFECQQCELTAAYLPDLNHHQSSHGGGKPYCCPQCSKNFRRGSDLVRQHGVHTGEKPSPCPQCDCCFSLSSNLTRHRRSHSGLRPHKCLECEEPIIGRSSDTGGDTWVRSLTLVPSVARLLVLASP